MVFLKYYSLVPKSLNLLLHQHLLKSLIDQNLIIYIYHFELEHFRVLYPDELYFFYINSLKNLKYPKIHLKLDFQTSFNLTKIRECSFEVF